MKFVYFGSGYFSRCVLESLCAKKNFPVLVVSQPDTTQGRGMKLAPTEVTTFARKHNLALITPHSLKRSETHDTITATGAEIIVVADYGKLLPQGTLRIPSIMPLAVHPSLLPLWRGPAPIARALVNGDAQTGVTIFKMNEKLDAGEIIRIKKITIAPGENVLALTTRLAREGTEVLIEVMDAIAQKKYTLTPQDEARATYAAKLTKEDGKMHWEWEAIHIHNYIRATTGWPSAYTFCNTVLIKIIEAEIIPTRTRQPPATIIEVTKKGIDVATGSGILRIKKLKPQGKKEMDAYAFTLGHPLKPGDTLG